MRNKIFLSFLIIVLTYVFAFYASDFFINKTAFNGCVNCHDNMEGFEPSHSPSIIGCNACHLGNPNTSNKIFAHRGMILIPGNTSDAAKTCGAVNCHPGIPDRINNSIMNTMSGVISVNRFAFNELEKPEGHFDVKDLTQSNADNHNRNLCASCHLSNVKTEWGPINELSRGGGCNACHLNYNDLAIKQLNDYLKSKVESQKSKESNIDFPQIHPQLSLTITNDHCFGCHSRSGRISTNYEGWFETLLNWDEIKRLSHSELGSESNWLKLKQVQQDTSNAEYRLLMDGRVFQKTQDDVHHAAGMLCIDCHVSLEIMGDGNIYQHMEEQTKVQCIDCHSNESQIVNYSQLDFESKKIADLRHARIENENFLVTVKSNIPLLNTYVKSTGQKYLVTKSGNQNLNLKSPSKICIEGKAHKRLSCSSCHTEWVSHCVGCHTEFDPTLEGYDLLANKDITGSWNETPSDFYVDYPVLGVRKEKNGLEVIDTFLPGMVLTLENLKNDSGKKIFKRLFAPTFSHTINKKGRSCKSCHNNPLAIGYGKGELYFSKKGKWNFHPQMLNHPADNLPKDAWIGFLQSRDETSTTRVNTRPFTVDEQKKVLLVGACLTCHEEKSYVMSESLNDFEKLLNRISKKCVLPKY